MERVEAGQGGKAKVIEQNPSAGKEKTPKEKIIDYCKQLGNFEGGRLEYKESGEFVFARRLPDGKSGGIYRFDKEGKLKDVIAYHDIRRIPTKEGKIISPELEENKFDA